MEFITGFLALAFAAIFALSAVNRGKVWGAKSRLDLVLSGVDAVVVLFAARLLMPWSIVSPWLWMIPVAIVAAGVGFAVIRWSGLPVTRPDKSRRHAVIWGAVHAAVLAALVFLLVG